MSEILHGRNKHIETRCHFIREQWVNQMLEVSYCQTKLSRAYEFTMTIKTNILVFLSELGLVYI